MLSGNPFARYLKKVLKSMADYCLDCLLLGETSFVALGSDPVLVWN